VEARPADGLAVDFVVEADRVQLVEIVQRVRDGRLRTNIGEVANGATPPLVAMTEHTITSTRRLRADLDETRRRGWGQVDEELYLDVGGVAAVAPTPGHRLVGIGVSYPIHRTTTTKVRRYGSLVVDAAQRLADAVGPLV
jgi:DNA-binding IclR family transcriptional regulator